MTTADLSDQFASLANPFLMVGEIERRLRRSLGTCFTIEELGAFRDDQDADRPVNSADDLTLGEIVRALARREYWLKLGWDVERTVFVQSLHEVREIRNEIMHFSPDPRLARPIGTRYRLIG